MIKRKNKKLNNLIDAVDKAEENIKQSHLNGVQDLVNTYLSCPNGRARTKAITEIVKKHSDLQDVLNNNDDVIIGMVEQALMQAATGYTYEEREVRTVNGRKTVKVTTKQMPPNQAAMEFYLTNKASDRYQRNPTNKADGSGKVDEIMEAIKHARKTKL